MDRGPLTQPAPPGTASVPTMNSLDDGTLDDLLGDDQHESIRYADLDLRGRRLAGATFLECRLERLDLTEANLRGARFVSTHLTGLTAPVLAASRLTLREVELTSSRLGAAEMYESTWQSVVVEDCKIEWLNLRAAKLRDVVFRRCQIGDLDLGSAHVTGMRFEGCTVGTLTLDDARLADVDLRDARIELVSSLDGLRGTTMTEHQVYGLVPAFAERFGFTVDE
jgi:uncharacterized protein YjbI with pentapeptide repeats